MTTRTVQQKCDVCGAVLEHATMGRPKRFCSDACKMKYHRAMRKWARESIDALLAGEPEPERPFAGRGRFVTVEV